MKNLPKSTIFTGILCIILCLAIAFLLYRDGYFNILKEVSAPDGHYDYTKNAQYTQRETTFALSQIEKSDIVFLGDSITARINWNEFYPDYTVLNRGIDSDVVEGGLNRLDHVIETNPQKVFVMLGINDIRQGIDADETLTYYSMLMSRLKDALPSSQIYIQSILPVAKKTGIDNHDVESLNTSIKALAEEYGLTYIDIFHDMITEDYDLPERFSVDGVHMTGDGYQVWLNKLSEYLK